MKYRDLLYRYSTGLGPNLTVPIPEDPIKYGSFQMKPQKFILGRDEFTVDLKRQADRIAMQVEVANQMIKNLGNSLQSQANLANLRRRLKLMNYLLFNSGLRYIRLEDLEELHRAYAQDPANINPLMLKTIAKNRKATGVARLQGKPYQDSNMPRFDRYGRNDAPQLLPSGFTFDGWEDSAQQLLPAVVIGLLVAYMCKGGK